jgi:ATP-binding cassette subfamily F protein 3
MIIVALNNIAKGFPLGSVLRGVDWEIKSREKIALLGKNGSGKSTLLGILGGRTVPDTGARTLGRGARIVEMGQIPDRSPEIKLFDYMVSGRGDLVVLQDRVSQLEREVAQAPHDTELQEQLGIAQSELEDSGGYELEHQIERILTGLGFSSAQWYQSLAHFSGGERTRIELGRLLLTPADLWLLDEPTNHLDIPAVEWLEEFLANSAVACVLVSHDRVLLERFAGRVAELVAGRLETYDGDYRYYLTEREVRHERRLKAYEMQQTEIKRIEDFIARNIAGQKTRQAQSRRRALGKLERLEAPKKDSRAMKLGFEAERTSFREVLTVTHFSKRYGEMVILDNVTLACERGDKIGVIGPNGAGKSTLLQAIAGVDDGYTGRIRIGQRVEMGYFDQHLDILSGHGSVIEEIWDEYPHFDAGELRSYLGRFLFTGDDVFKAVAALSGGEKCRLALAKLMLTKANFLVLDEPTNHLDIAAREVLEDALAEFEGTALVVSHDRRFLDRFTNKIIYVAGRNASMSLGNYSDWARRQSARDNHFPSASKERPSASDAAAEWKERKARRAQSQKLQRARQKLEESIATTEQELQTIETELADESLAREWERLAELTGRRERLYQSLSAMYEELESLPRKPADDA